jgi:hypothetical protein
VSAANTGLGYISPLAQWDRVAAVRRRPRRTFDEDGECPIFFPLESVPAVSHPLVTDRGGRIVETVLLHSLYQYLHFTTVLEQVAVIPVSSAIAMGRAGVTLSAALRSDAFKITTDEAWHAQFSHDFAEQLAASTGIPPSGLVTPRFVDRLDRARECFDPAHRDLTVLTFATVSETLISSLLADIPRDDRLPPSVRALVADHAADEGRHNAYFKNVLRNLWPQLSEAERRLVGPRIPEFIEIFLQPDLASVRSLLQAAGLSERDAANVVEDVYTRDCPLYDLAPAARGTVRAYRSVGALDDPATFEAFEAAGLLPTPASS